MERHSRNTTLFYSVVWKVKQDCIFFFFFCVRCDDHAKSSGRWLLGSPLSAAVPQLAPRAWCPLQCLLAKTVSRCGQVWRMCSGICSSKPHSQWAESARPNLFRCFLCPQWPVRRWKMVVWVLLSRVLIWSFCGSYPLVFCLFLFFFCLQADFCMFQNALDFFIWGGEVRLREFCCCLCQSVCSLVSSNANMRWHPLEHYSVVVWQYAGCCVAAGCEGQWGHLSETEEQTGSQTAKQYSAGCSLPRSVLWQLSGRVLLLCSWSSGHQLGWRGRRLFHLGNGCRHHCLHS